MNKFDNKTTTWCPPTHLRAAKGLAESRMNQLAMGSVENKQQYICRTQRGTAPTIGAAPAAHFDDKKSPNKKPDSLVVGIGSIVPRWDVRPPTTLSYFVREDTFPSKNNAHDAATAFQQAADEWNTLNLGIVIGSIDDQVKANFYLVWKPDDPANEGVLAEAFFPNEKDQDVVVYAYALAVPENKAILKNIFMHEIGHILGLRHEFAVEKEGEGAIMIWGKIPGSIMSYDFPPTLQEKDKEQVKEFYQLPNGTKLAARPGRPVTDYEPQIRKNH